MSQLEIDFETLMTRIPRGFRADRSEGISAIIQFKFDDTGNWILHIQNQECDVTAGDSDRAMMTIKTNSETWKKVMLGQLDAMQAMTTGKIEISTDDMDLLMRFARLFKFTADMFLLQK